MWQSISIILIIPALLFSDAALSVNLPPPAVSRTALIPTSVDAKVTGDSVEGHRLLRLQVANSDASYAHPYEPVGDPNAWLLPMPEVVPQKPKHLSLREAIVLALRDNPDIKAAELQRILDKFSLELAKQATGIKWSALTASATLVNGAAPVWASGTKITANAPTGTTLSIQQTNNLLGGMGVTTVNMTQHLLKGFGLAVNRIPYQNAIDAEKVARLNFKNSVILVVVNVITNYRALVAAYNTLTATKQSVAAQEQSVKQDKLRVKVGQMAPSELIQDQASLEGVQLQVVQQEEALRDDYQTFLSSLGLVATTNVLVDKQISTAHVHIPSLKKCTDIALKNNIAYQAALINLNATKRALITAKDARKWTLDMTSSVVASAQRTAVGSPITDTGTTNPSLAFSLSIPLDDIATKKGVVSAQIAIENAKLTLEKTKEDLIRSVADQWDSVQNDQKQIKISESQLTLQEQTVKNERLQLQYGKVSMLDFTTVQSQLLAQQQALIMTKMGYLNDITTLYQTLGMTLDRWQIKLRY